MDLLQIAKLQTAYEEKTKLLAERDRINLDLQNEIVRLRAFENKAEEVEQRSLEVVRVVYGWQARAEVAEAAVSAGNSKISKLEEQLAKSETAAHERGSRVLALSTENDRLADQLVDCQNQHKKLASRLARQEAELARLRPLVEYMAKYGG